MPLWSYLWWKRVYFNARNIADVEQLKKENEESTKEPIEIKSSEELTEESMEIKSFEESTEEQMEIKSFEESTEESMEKIFFEEDGNTTEWFDRNKFKIKKIGRFKYNDIKDLVNNIRNNTVSKIQAKNI